MLWNVFIKTLNVRGHRADLGARGALDSPARVALAPGNGSLNTSNPTPLLHPTQPCLPSSTQPSPHRTRRLHPTPTPSDHNGVRRAPHRHRVRAHPLRDGQQGS
jgi:hypothetical protein